MSLSFDDPSLELTNVKDLQLNATALQIVVWSRGHKPLLYTIAFITWSKIPDAPKPKHGQSIHLWAAMLIPQHVRLKKGLEISRMPSALEQHRKWYFHYTLNRTVREVKEQSEDSSLFCCLFLCRVIIFFRTHRYTIHTRFRHDYT